MSSADLILHTGDFTAGSVLDDLRRWAPVEAVHGNMDDASLRAELPGRLVVEAEGLRIGLVHDGGPGLGRHERLLSWFPECNLIAYGHSHRSELVRIGGVWIVNPGSPTERRRAPTHTMALVRRGRPRLVELS